MKLHENIESAYVLVAQKKTLEEEKAEIERQISELTEKKKAIESKMAEFDSQINPYKSLILEMMKEANVKNVEVENIVAQIMSREGFSWVDEEAILKYLQENKLTDYIQVKYSFKKPALKKAIEEKAELKEALKNYIATKGTEYLVITDKESFDKMIAHMEENK